jgi:hypothetical protein
MKGFRASAVLCAFLIALGWAASVARAGTTYFLVAERPGTVEHGDSFVLPLERPDDIAHARDLVRFGAERVGGGLIGADVVAGADNVNRNLLDPARPAWSWHVSKFDGFGDASIELVDGWPGFIEQDVHAWIDNTGGGHIDNDGDGVPDGDHATVGRVGFWNYTVVAELTGDPTNLQIIPSAVIPLPAGAWGAGVVIAGIIVKGIRRRRI